MGHGRIVLESAKAIAKKMTEIGTSLVAWLTQYKLCHKESMPENFYNIVVDRLKDGLRNQAILET